MKMKAKVGEFSLDLYFNDFAKPQEAYVALLVQNYDRAALKKVHFRAPSFRKALNRAEKYLRENCR